MTTTETPQDGARADVAESRQVSLSLLLLASAATADHGIISADVEDLARAILSSDWFVSVIENERRHDAATIEALSTHLAKKVRPPALPIGTRVAVRSFKGQVGTVIAGDGTESHPGLGVIMDRPWPKGFPGGHACVSLDEVTVVP